MSAMLPIVSLLFFGRCDYGFLVVEMMELNLHDLTGNDSLYS